jgi:ribosomal protein S12 methylthiotransferase accessory factor
MTGDFELDRAFRTDDPVRKAFNDGTQRTVSTEETWRRIRPFFRDFGITRVANLTGLDSLGIPVCAAFRPNSRSLAVSQGKGVDVTAAMVSAAMESIEGFHAEGIALPLRLGTIEELSRELSLVDARRLPLAANKTFDARSRILWIEAKHLLDGTGIWVPMELVHLSFTVPALTGSGYFVASSNGLASGNHLLEAVSHGLCEVIERDAVTLWALFGEEYAEKCRVDLATLDDPAVLPLLEQFERGGVSVAVWDITSDVGVAAFACAIINKAPSPLHPWPHARGMGCHPSRRIALMRALTEAAQSRLTVIAGSRDDLKQTRYRELLDPESQERTRKLIVERQGTRRYRDIPTFEAETFDADVRHLATRLRTVGLGAPLIVDLTRPNTPFAVVRVLVPGLEAMYDMPGYTPGQRAKKRVLQQAAS